MAHTAAVTLAAGVLLFQERPAPAPPAPGATLVRVEAVGVCGSDLHLFHADLGETHEGLLPLVQGHELSAVVTAADPAGGGPGAGERVAVWPVRACAMCRPCRDGRPNVCRNLSLLGVHVDGGLQEYLTVPTASLVAVPGLTARQTPLVEPMSIALHSLDRGRVEPGQRVVVLGAGPIGFSTAVAARDRGATVVAVDPAASRRELLARIGIPVLPCELDSLQDSVAAWAGLDGPHTVVDTTGSPAALGTAMELVGHGGCVVVVGMTSRTASLSPGLMPVKEIDVLGASCATYDDFVAAAHLVSRRAAEVTTMVSHVLPLEALEQALHLLEERPPAACKVLVEVTTGLR